MRMTQLGGISMATMYASESEAALHEAAIDALATEMHRPVAEIKPYYERELSRLMDGARVRDFLSVCATRHLRQALRTPHA
jgi:predicted dienelactone hydrolase